MILFMSAVGFLFGVMFVIITAKEKQRSFGELVALAIMLPAIMTILGFIVGTAIYELLTPYLPIIATSLDNMQDIFDDTFNKVIIFIHAQLTTVIKNIS